MFIVNDEEQKCPFLKRNLGKHDVGNGEENNPEICYEIVYLDDTAEPRFRLERRRDNTCPFCGFDALSRDKVMKHLRRFHRDHHSFTSTEAVDGMITVILKPTRAYYNQAVSEALKHQKDQMFRYGKYEDFQFLRFRSSKSKRMKRRRVKPLLPPQWNLRNIPNLDEPWASEVKANFAKFTPSTASKQYFHSRTRLPMRPGDWDVDSDDESRNEWMDQWGQAGLHEFIDVDDKEKQILDLWNRYIRSDSVIADTKFQNLALEFVKSHASSLAQSRQQLMMLLTLFCEQRLIPPDHILVCLKVFDEMKQKTLHDPSNSEKGSTTSKPFDNLPEY